MLHVSMGPGQVAQIPCVIMMSMDKMGWLRCFELQVIQCGSRSGG